jgi:quercetin dioxygenase-like cupin family protein
MILKHPTEVPVVKIEREGFSKMNARFLLTAQDGCPHYALRLMEIDPDGHTSFHCHQEEHELFFLAGKGLVIGDDQKEVGVTAGDVIYVEPREYHQIKNTGSQNLQIICTVPILPGKDGRNTTPCK